MALAIFDLDNTLLGGDSDYLWGEFLVERGVVERESYEAANRRFYQQYKDGVLDIHEFLEFALRPLAEHDVETLERWRETFIEQKIRPIVLDAARHLVATHRERGDTLLIITATNAFVTEKIAELFAIEHLLATVPERLNGRYTGRVIGTPTFREGKIKALHQWLDGRAEDLSNSWFYTDSQNDIPLLEQVDHPVAVDPDDILRRVAAEREWPVISLRN